MCNTLVYSTSLSHPNMFSASSGKTMVDTTLESINRCISLLVLTGFTELFGEPEFGSSLYEVTFDHISEAYFEQLKLIISDAIAKFETRVTCSRDHIRITHNPENNHVYIRIGYIVNGTNQHSETIVSVEATA